MLYVEVWTNESRVFCVRWPSDSAVLTLDGSLFHRQGAKIEKSRDFAEQALFALSERPWRQFSLTLTSFKHFLRLAVLIG